MRWFGERQSEGLFQSVRGSLMLLSFGLTVLAFLIAIEHPEWFRRHVPHAVSASMAKSAAQADNAPMIR